MLVEAANTLADSFRKATTLTYQFPLATAGRGVSGTFELTGFAAVENTAGWSCGK
jgi:hypothetical protein